MASRYRRLLALVGTLILGMVLASGVLAQGPSNATPGGADTPRYEVIELNSPEAEDSLKPETENLAPLPDASFMPGPGNFGYESEPNNTVATADVLGALPTVGNIFPNGDVDVYSFTAAAGDRVYAATMTNFSANGNFDSVLELLDLDGTTILETDNDDGSFGPASSSIAGRSLAAGGTYYLRVRHNLATSQLRPYRLYFQLRGGAPIAETEPNNNPTPQPLPASNWVSGVIATTADNDMYSLSLNAGDTVFLSLDADPERDGTTWNPRLGLGIFANNILVVNDTSVTSPNSEAHFMTVQTAGTYVVYVDTLVAGAATATYTLSVTVYPAVPAGPTCTTYTSTNVPQTIPPVPALVSSTITIPGNPRIADMDVSLNLTHTFMNDLDVTLVSPQGNENGLFSDIGPVVSAPATMTLTLDDEAAIPIGTFLILRGMHFQPEFNYRLGWFYGEDAGGTWTLNIRDDANQDGGTLLGWSIRICEPAPPPACPAGTAPITVYGSDFEAGDGGFTHSGTADEWQRGLPTGAPIATCNSGTNCWETDLAGTYELNSNQDLLSPNINLAGVLPPIQVSWAQRYQMESASFDHASVDVRQVGPSNPTRLWEWMDATMTNGVGNPIVTTQESAGWSLMRRDISAYAGQNVEFLFHLDSDNSTNLDGFAIDDVMITGCRLLVADVGVTKTANPSPVTAGDPLTYTLSISNVGPDAAASTIVTDALPADVTFVSANPAVCAEGPTDTLVCNLGSVPSGTQTIDVNVTVDSAAACGAGAMLTNNASISSSVSDPNGANNSTTLNTPVDCIPDADLSVTKAANPATVVAGDPLTYTLTINNAGPDAAANGTVTDTLPADVTFVSANPAICTEGPTDTLVCNLGTVPTGTQTIDVNVTVDASAACGAGVNLTNNATIGSSTLDSVPGNNSATLNTPVTCAPAIVTSTSALTSTQDTNQVLTQTFTIDNTGGADLTWNIIEEGLQPRGIRGSAAQQALVGGCLAVPIPWASVNPTNGTTAGAGSTPVDVTFDSTGLATGTYTGDLCIASNDAQNPEVRVALTLIVLPPTAVQLAELNSRGASGGLLPLGLAAGLLTLGAAGWFFHRRRAR